MDSNDKNKKPTGILHGNNARICPHKEVVPRFTGYVLNDNLNENNRVFNRLGDDAEFCKREVDNNEK